MRKKYVDVYHGFAVLLLMMGIMMACGGGGGGGSTASGTTTGGSTTGSTTYTLSGKVTGVVQQGVAINLSGAGPATTTTSAGGTYSFTGLSNGNYTVTASLSNYVFSPASQDIPVNSANVVAADFVSVQAYSLSGLVVNGSAVAMPDVAITLTGVSVVSAATATSDSTGSYIFNDLVAGSYMVTPSKSSVFDTVSNMVTLYTFTPSSQAVSITNLNVTVPDFVTTVTTTSAYTISGKIVSGTLRLGAPLILEGLTIWRSDPISTWISTTTDANGNYAFIGVPNGSYTIRPANFHTGSCPYPTDYSFSPTSRTITVSGSDLTVSDFAENGSRSGCATY